MTLSDQLLLAYVDGQLDRPQASIVAQLVRDDRDVAQRVTRFQQTQTQFLDTFGALLREGSSSAARAQKTAYARQAAKPKAVAGKLVTAGLLVLTGAGIGLTGAYATGLLVDHPAKEIIQMPASGWPGDIAEFHSFFTKESLLVSPDSQTNPEMVAFQLSQNFGGLSIPDFREQELDFLRGQMLTYRGDRVMQIIYAGKNEMLVALYVGNGGLDIALAPGRFGDLNTMSWTAGERRYVLAADMPHQALRALAVIAQAQFNGR
jgi:anti-sigma factor RsiW